MSVNTDFTEEEFPENHDKIISSIECMIGEMFSNFNVVDENEFYKEDNTDNIDDNTVESYVSNNLFRSEEVYFGLNNQFSKELLNFATLLIDETKRVVAGSSDPVQTIKNNVGNNVKITKLKTIIDDLGSCIARHCNIEKCYIGLSPYIDAYTIPMICDSSLILTDMENSVRIEGGYIYIKKDKIRTGEDIQKQLFKLEDIAIVKDGYKFKDKTGKSFIISIGVPILYNKNFETTPEDVCSVLLHEIGHNFQQMLHGLNQFMIDRVIKYNLSNIARTKFYDILGILDNISSNKFIQYVLKKTQISNDTRMSLIRSILLNGIYIDRNNKIVTRNDIGTKEMSYLLEAIEIAKANNALPTLSLFTKIMYFVGKTIKKIVSLIFLPISNAFNTAKRNNLDKEYHDVIQYNKIYEQFADAFAVAYGFGSSSTKFFINIQKLINKKKEDGRIISAASFLNYIPVLSKMSVMNQLNTNKIISNTAGYDEDHVRIAQLYTILEHELSTNKDLTQSDKKEIVAQMDSITADFELFKKLELGNITTNKSVIKKVMETLRSGNISEVGLNSGIVENVLDSITNFKDTGKVNQPDVVEMATTVSPQEEKKDFIKLSKIRTEFSNIISMVFPKTKEVITE